MVSKTKASNDKKGGTILFVDDEPLSLKYFKASVGKYAKVKTASSPAAAKEILESDGDEITVVVSDERMPRESGVSFLSDVRKSWPSTVRVLTSAYANIDNLQHAINDAAIYRFVPKPWNLDELCAAMQDALDVEQSASALAEPALGPVAGGDAEDANLALLAILANGFDTPLKSLETEAAELVDLSRQGTLEAPHPATSYMASWSSRLRMSKMTASAGQVQKMPSTADHWQIPSASSRVVSQTRPGFPTSSMSDTLQEVLEQNRKGSFSGPVLDTSRDFVYQMPREIMKFILASLLRGGSARARQPLVSGAATIELFSGAVHNEVRIHLGPDHPSVSLDDNQSWRTIRSALWAFGGELVASTDENLGKPTLILCLPMPS